MKSSSRIDLKPEIAVIDDDPAVLNSLKFSLEIEGFAVQTYLTGSQALDTADLSRFGCLIIDYHLPGMNGLDVLRALRERRIGAPAILITSHPSKSLRDRAADAGVKIVEKPLLGNTLVDGVRRALERGTPFAR